MNSTGAPPQSQAQRNGGAVPPPPPTGSILQKQSSFSRTKNASPKNSAPGAAPGAAAAPANGAGAPRTSPAAAAKPPAPTPQTRPASGSMGSGTSAPKPGAAPAASGTRAAPAASPSSGARPVAAASPAAGARPAAGAQPARPAGGAPPTQSPSALARKNSAGGAMPGSFGGPMGGSAYGSMAGGQPPSGYGSMAGPGSMAGVPGSMNGYGSMAGPQGMSGYGSMGPGQASMFGGQVPSGYGSMNPGIAGMGGSAYGSMAGGQPPSGYGSMAGPQGMSGYGSMAGPQGMSGYGSMGSGAGGNSMYGPGAMSGYGSVNQGMPGGSFYGSRGGSMYGMGGPGMGSMYQPMGSIYGMGGMGGGMSAYGFAAQWGSLANMGGHNREVSRSGITSGYGGFAEESKGMADADLCPNIGTFEGAKELKRSGKRGGNRLYSRGKNEKPVMTSNSNASAMTIKRKADLKGGAGGTSSGGISAGAGSSSNISRGNIRASPSAASSSGKPRAKAPTNYMVHTLVLVDKAASPVLTVKDPNTAVFDKGGKKETFECDEALDRATEKEEVDSVMLSELRGNWFNGHNSALMMCNGKGKDESSKEVVRGFLKKCMDRLEKNEKDTSVKYDVSLTMFSIRGADQCADLLKSGADYAKMDMGSSPVYGPCLMGLETKSVKTADECLKAYNSGLANAKESKEIVGAFLVLKTIKKSSSEVDVHLSSLCIALCGENIQHMLDIKDKASGSPHRLFRYAVDGACVTVSAVCLAANDGDALKSLEMERKMREVKNQPPRSGNVKRFIDYTYKEITRQKEKAESASGSEKKTRESQIKRMEEMVADAKALLADPEKVQAKGYSMASGSR